MNGGHDSKSGLLDKTSGSLRFADAADPLSQMLESIRLRGAVFFVWEPRQPFATSVPNGELIAPLVMPGLDQLISYHIVVEGPCWGCIEGQNPVQLDTGDILLLPHGDAYVISNEAAYPDRGQDGEATDFFKQMAAGKLPPVVANGGQGPGMNRIICGFLGCDMRPYNPLLNSLPPMIRVRPPRSGNDPLNTLIDLAVAESRNQSGGGHCLLLRLSEVMFVEVIRRYTNTGAERNHGWLSALNDPIVHAALSHLHQNVSHPWTLESLARTINTSRSTLADHFTRKVGEPPMQYLTNWRMQLAARRLCDGATKNYAIAREIGYASEAAFSRAFKRVVGVSPREWRLNHSQSGAEKAST